VAIYTLDVYDYNPSGIFPTVVSQTFVYSGPATATGTATITDNQAGLDGETLSALASGETATADVSVGGNSSTGSNVDAEDAWTIRDTVTGRIFQVTSMEVRSGGAIGHYLISEYPMVAGRTYEVLAYDNLPSTSGGDPILNYTEVVCFTPGALILTPKGEVPVQRIRVGDLVTTMDNGPQRVRWIGRRHLDRQALDAAPHLKPVLIRAGCMGNRRDLLVSPQHRMLVSGRWLPAAGEAHETLVRARHLAENLDGRWRFARGKTSVDYIHLMFDAHQIIFAEGAPSESLFPGPMALNGMDRPSRQELFEICPDLLSFVRFPNAHIGNPYGVTARPVARRKDVKAWCQSGV